MGVEEELGGVGVELGVEGVFVSVVGGVLVPVVLVADAVTV